MAGLLATLLIHAHAAPDASDQAAVRADKGGPQPLSHFSIPDRVEVSKDIAYRKGNDKWKLDLAQPAWNGGPLRPAIVFIHGGGWSGGDKRTGYFFQGALDFAQKGYVCVSVNYRLSGEAPFPAAVEDVRTAVRWLRAHAAEYHVDPDRIGAYGNSAGAHLAQMLALPEGHDPALDGDGPWREFSAKVQAACTSATPTDFLTLRPRGRDGGGRPGGGLGFLDGPADTLQARATAASPVTYVTPDDPPVLLIHGGTDGTVAIGQAEELVAKLHEAGSTEANLITIDGVGHGVFMQHRETTIPAMEAFFARTLAPNP